MLSDLTITIRVRYCVYEVICNCIYLNEIDNKTKTKQNKQLRGLVSSILRKAYMHRSAALYS